MTIKRGYRDLEVWGRGKALAVCAFKATASINFRSDWGLRDQIRRSAISVPSNIAEGSQRGSDRESIRFFYYSRASIAELSTQLEIALEVGLIDATIASPLLDECETLSAMLMKLIEARRQAA